MSTHTYSRARAKASHPEALFFVRLPNRRLLAFNSFAAWRAWRAAR